MLSPWRLVGDAAPEAQVLESDLAKQSRSTLAGAPARPDIYTCPASGHRNLMGQSSILICSATVTVQSMWPFPIYICAFRPSMYLRFPHQYMCAFSIFICAFFPFAYGHFTHLHMCVSPIYICAFSLSTIVRFPHQYMCFLCVLS